MTGPPVGEADATRGVGYTRRLARLGGAWWKRAFGAQAPYRWHLRRLQLGHTLDVGCGIGRNLAHLGGRGVGVDHNPTSVALARARGLRAYTVEEFPGSGHARPAAFDAILAAHLLEHLPEPAGRRVLASYLPYLRPGGRLVIITPQERGFASDPTHVRFVGFDEAARLAAGLGLTVLRRYSFPFPRVAGRVFTHNEFVVVARRDRG